MSIDTTFPADSGAASGAAPDVALGTVRRRDELLSMLYWLRADGLHEAPRAVDLAPFAGAQAPLETDLQTLAAAGLLAVVEGEDERRFCLTAFGLEEGKRRFKEDFEALPDDGTAGNAHEVIVGVCGPNAKCVRDGSHEECVEPVLATDVLRSAAPASHA